MKKIFIIITYFFALTIVSCSEKGNSDNNIKFPFKNNTSDTIGLVGEWSCCAIQSGTGDSISTMQVNVCTIINFNIDNSAIVTIPSGDKGRLTWRLNKNKVILTNTDSTNKDNLYFNEGEYEMIFTNKKEYTELKLILTDKHLIYILGR